MGEIENTEIPSTSKKELDILAIIMGRNCALTLAPVLKNFEENQIPVIFIDHGSSDDTVKIVNRYLGSPVIEILTEPFDGVFSLNAQLQTKMRVLQEREPAWVIHCDADEIFESPVEDESLRDFIERNASTGFDVIDCDEFVFVPKDESENFEGPNFVEKMRRFYFFAPPRRKLHRIFRYNTVNDRWIKSGGHSIAPDSMKIAPEHARMRHYVGLSLNHIRRQYLGRVFSGAEILHGFHGNRVASHQDFIIPPDENKLINLDADGWSTKNAESKHSIFDQREKFTPPSPMPDQRSYPPMPFIVGVGRSGTTLLRMLMDAHTELAIPPETHWLSPLIDEFSGSSELTEANVLNFFRTARFWTDMGISDQELSSIFSRGYSKSISDVIRSIYRQYSDRFGASRIGDKTPIHQLAMGRIAKALPEAHFIHIIRDGRDCACSHKSLWFGPGRDMRMAARMWVWRIARARQLAEFLPYYMEVRYEDLVRDPEKTLREICKFIDLEFQPTQLRAFEKSAERLSELGPLSLDGLRRETDGATELSADKRQSIHELTSRPPDPARIGRWRTGLTSDEVMQFESVAGDMLRDLGYA